MEDGESRTVSPPDTNAASLVRLLGSDQWLDRRRAEDGLRGLRGAALPALTEALSSSSDQVRWGAARVLSDIADPATAPVLAGALEDPEGGVRWVAAEALIAIGPGAVAPVLRQLLARPDSPWLLEGAHHVLRSLATPTVSPVIRAIEGHFPSLGVPVAANEALKELEQRSA